MRFLRPVAATVAAVCLVALGALPAAAGLLIEIDKSTQRMTVSQDGARIYNWPVSTGIRRYDTPGGAYTPFRMAKQHFSREWDDAPMPHSIFFTAKGHAIHGTEHLRNIGRPASHGCVRLEPQNARALFDLVKREGMANTRVVLTGTTPVPSAPAVARRAPRQERPRYDDRDVTGAVSARRVERDDPRDQRPIYWGRAPDRPPAYDERDAPSPGFPPPPPFFFPGPRPGWD